MRVRSQVSWKSCVAHEALAFRRWVPQSRMEMASVVDPRIPKNISSENEPCLIHLYPWKPSAQTHCKRPGPSDAQDPFSGHISGLPVLLQRSLCPWQICLSLKEVTLSQALLPPGQGTSCGSILKTTHMIINAQPKRLGCSSGVEQTFNNTQSHGSTP